MQNQALDQTIVNYIIALLNRDRVETFRTRCENSYPAKEIKLFLLDLISSISPGCFQERRAGRTQL